MFYKANKTKILIIGILIQIVLGTVYAWSIFQKPLVQQYGWSNSMVTWTFSIAIFCLGVSAAWGGIKLPYYGPRKLAMLGGILYAIGNIGAGLALFLHSIWILYFFYGIVGGTGLGLAYVTPIATVSKWFDKNKGFSTGMVVMGFGIGALLMSKIIAPWLLTLTQSTEFPQGNLIIVFIAIGSIFLITMPILSLFLVNPVSISHELKAFYIIHDLKNIVFTGTFGKIWLVFFLNITAGISIISFQSPLLQDLLKLQKKTLSITELAPAGATLIAVSSIFNGLGRLIWGTISDKIGQINVFKILMFSQILVFIVLSQNTQPWLFFIMVCYILLCYGGGFGTIPSFINHIYGSQKMPIAYGAVLTAWSMAGIIGPQMIAVIKDHFPSNSNEISFILVSILLGIGGIFALTMNKLILNRK